MIDISEKEYKEYQIFTNECFRYLKNKFPKIPDNKLDIIICERATNVDNGELLLSKNLIIIYLINILNKYYRLGEHIAKTRIILSITNELMHSNQIINAEKYFSNKGYAEDVENQAEYMSCIYLINNYKTIRNILYDKFDVVIINKILKELIQNNKGIDLVSIPVLGKNSFIKPVKKV